MFQRLKEAVAAAFDDRPELPPAVSLGNGAQQQPFPLQPLVTAVCTHRVAPHLVAYEPTIGLLVTISDRDDIVAYSVGSAVIRQVISIRAEEWLSCRFVPATGWLLLMSTRVLMLLDVEACMQDLGDSTLHSTTLYMTPSRLSCASLCTFAGTSFAAVGTSHGTLMFAKFAGHALAAPSAPRRQQREERQQESLCLQWSQFSIDVAAKVEQDLPHHLLLERTSQLGPCVLYSCVAYANDPNALLCLGHNIAGVTKIYLLEDRISALFILPSEQREEPIVSVHVTPGGGFVVAMLAQKVVVWNEQSSKQKDRTAAPHFVVDLPFSSPMASRELAVTSLVTVAESWLVDAADGRVLLTSVHPTSRQSVIALRLQCEKKALESFEEVELSCFAEKTTDTITSVSLCDASPWQSAWQEATTSRCIICTTSGDVHLVSLKQRSAHGIVATELLRYGSSAGGYSCATAAPNVGAASPPPVLVVPHSEATFASHTRLPPAPWDALMRPRSDVERCKTQTPFFAVFANNNLTLTFEPTRNRCWSSVSVQGSFTDATTRFVTARRPPGWGAPTSSRTVAVPVCCACLAPLVLVVYTAAGESSPSARALVCALVDAAAHQVISFDVMSVSLLPLEGPEADAVFTNEVVDVLPLAGRWNGTRFSREESCKYAVGAAIRLIDGSFAFMNAFTASHNSATKDGDGRGENVTADSVAPGMTNTASTDGLFIPSILFPAADPVIDFTCALVARPVAPRSPGHVVPVAAGGTAATAAAPSLEVLALLAVTSKRSLVIVDVSRMQVVGARPLLQSNWDVGPLTTPRTALRIRSLSDVVWPAPHVDYGTALAASPLGAQATIFPWNTVLSPASTLSLPLNFAVQVSFSWIPRSSTSVKEAEPAVEGGVGATAEISLLPYGGGHGALRTRITVTSRSTPAGCDGGDNAAGAPDGSKGVNDGPLSLTASCSVILDGREVIVHDNLLLPASQPFTSPADTNPNDRSVSLNCRVDEGTELLLLTFDAGENEDRNREPIQLPLATIAALRNGGRVGGCEARSPSGSDALKIVAIEILSLPGRLPVAGFVERLPRSRTQVSWAPEGVSCASVQVSDRCILLSEVDALVAAVQPSVTAGKGSNPSVAQKFFRKSIVFPEGEAIAHWVHTILPSGFATVPPTSLAVLLCCTRTTTAALHVYAIGVEKGELVMPQVTVRLPHPFTRSLVNIRVVLHPVVLHGEVHLYCLLLQADGNVADVAHVVVADAAAARITAVPPLQESWPETRLSLPVVASASASSFGSPKEVFKSLPPPPNSSKATQKEQGFFKRLIVSTVESQLEKIEALLSPVREETYEDALDRIMAPVERQMADASSTASQATTAEEKRKALLGSRYSEVSQYESRVRREMSGADQTRQQMNENLQLLHERGEKIDRVQNRSEELAHESAQFAELCKKLKEKERNRWF